MFRDWGIQINVRVFLVNSRPAMRILLQCKRFTSLALRTVGLKDDYVVLSVYGSRSSVEVSLLIGRSLNADINLVLADDGGRLVVADAALKSFEFWMVAVYPPNIAAKRLSFFLAVSAVPRRSKTDSFSGWLECDPWFQNRLGWKGN